MEIKFDLGVRTREAYLSLDKARVRKVAVDYDILLERLEVFYEAFRTQWMLENKPQGFEVHDTRIGGLMRRVQNCKRRLLEYAEGQLSCIDELEEPVLDLLCRGDSVSEADKKPFVYNCWVACITASII